MTERKHTIFSVVDRYKQNWKK